MKGAPAIWDKRYIHCCDMLKQYPDMIPTQTWGSMTDKAERDKWTGCETVVGGSSKRNCPQGGKIFLLVLQICI